MRVSTNMIFAAGVSGMNRQSAALTRLQQQLAAGRKILTPSDDPVAAARVLEVTQSQDIVKQYGANQESAKSALGLVEGQLQSASDLLITVRELTIQAGGPSLTAANRASIATTLRAHYDNLMGIANSADGQGQFQFSGYYQGTDKPFSGTVDTLNTPPAPGAEVTYAGDDGQRRIQVSASRQMEVSAAGSDVFVRTGNGESVFKTLATLIDDLENNNVANLTSTVAKLDNAGNNILNVRAAIGSRLNELDSLGDLNQDLNIQYAQTLSTLQDLDYAQAISDLTLKKTQLEAAQESFQRISQLSLFNYL